jgi:hypothetical protein
MSDSLREGSPLFGVRNYGKRATDRTPGESCFLSHSGAVWWAKEKCELLWRALIEILISFAKGAIDKTPVKSVVWSVWAKRQHQQAERGRIKQVTRLYSWPWQQWKI